MTGRRLAKGARHEQLQAELKRDPFITDEELAQRLAVSVQTIRLDRLELGIPEVRKRTRLLAAEAFGRVTSLNREEIFGELLELDPGRSGLSMMLTTEEMVLSRRSVIRGHFLFAQANSLAVAVVPAPVALTCNAEVHYQAQAGIGERLIAHAAVTQVDGRRYRVEVKTRRGADEIFRGEFVIVALEDQ